MTALAWIFMIVSVSCVSVLMFWCFRRVLTSPSEPAKQVEDFHSA